MTFTCTFSFFRQMLVSKNQSDVGSRLFFVEKEAWVRTPVAWRSGCARATHHPGVGGPMFLGVLGGKAG